MSDHRTRLALGTVQFGLPYGVANQQGQVSLTEVRDILKTANSFCITTLDTAYAYGQSEEVLGQCGELLKDFSIVTKLPPGTQTAQAAMEAIQKSLSRLHLKSVDAVLMHTFEDYRQCPEIIEALGQMKRQGLCKKIGFSLYYPSDLKLLLDQNVSFDVLQVPYSVFDRRFESFFDELASRHIEVHVRSVFLQGAVFISPMQLPEYLKSARVQWQRLHVLAKEQGLDVSSICLNFALSHCDISKVVIGIDSLEHLKNNVGDLSNYTQVEALLPVLKEIAIEDEKILLPFLWKK